MNTNIFYKIVPAFVLLAIAITSLLLWTNKESIANKPQVEQAPKKIVAVKTSAGEDQLNNLIKNGKPTMFFFTSQYCRDCQEMKPVMKALKKKYENQVDFLTIDIRADDQMSKEAIKRYRVLGVPLSVFVKKDGTKLKTLAGSYPSDEYDKYIKVMLQEKQTAKAK